LKIQISCCNLSWLQKAIGLAAVGEPVAAADQDLAEAAPEVVEAAADRVGAVEPGAGGVCGKREKLLVAEELERVQAVVERELEVGNQADPAAEVAAAVDQGEVDLAAEVAAAVDQGEVDLAAGQVVLVEELELVVERVAVARAGLQDRANLESG
jgi:hypothetical protein